MPVIITCPVCRTDVRLLQGGAVAVHGSPACTFTQTAHAGPTTRTQEQTAAHNRAKTAREKAAREKAARQTVNAPKPAAPAARKQPKAVCAVCGRPAQRSRKAATGLAAHLKQSGRWCPGGGEPTVAQRNKTKVKRSVWAVSGGLPSLGRR